MAVSDRLGGPPSNPTGTAANSAANPPRISLAPPSEISPRQVSYSEKLRFTLIGLATHDCVELRDLREFVSDEVLTEIDSNQVASPLGVEKYDEYDRYFDVARVAGDPILLLASAFVVSVRDLADDEELGTNIHAFAVMSILKSIKTQAEIYLEASNHDYQ